jgi:NhaA family Na+:H+ antiporter
MATDVAFALGVLALLGSRIPAELKVLLLGLAIVDDIGAIALIAAFYSEGIQAPWIAAAFGGLLLVAALRRGKPSPPTCGSPPSTGAESGTPT